MKELLGFVVLTGPLFLIVLWVPTSIALAWWVSKKFIKKKSAIKIAGGIAVFLVVLFLPLSDEIAGRIYFNHLCETEAGVKVYQTIELPAEYWDENGRPNFYDEKNGNLQLPANNVEWSSVVEKKSLHIEKNVSIMLEKVSGKKLNERILFMYWGGWLRRNFSPHNSANSCGGDVSAYTDFVRQVFQPISAAQLSGESYGDN